jgi:hypothetical protein
VTRARDRLGRPLPAGAPADPDVPPVPDLTGASDPQVWAAAMALVDAGLPFHAHEVFEDRWRRAVAEGSPGAVAWRALAQWGAALTHAARGNAVGASRLAERTLATLQDADQVPDAVDVARVRRTCTALVLDVAVPGVDDTRGSQGRGDRTGELDPA